MKNWEDGRLLGDRTRPDESFSIFYRRHVKAVIASCARRGVTSAQAADITAETFAAALLGRYRYRAKRESAGPWLMTIASNKTADVQRRAARDDRARRRLALEPIRPTDEDQAEYDALMVEASSALNNLPDAQRRAVQARVIRGASYAEISDAHGTTEAAARQNVSRGLAALRDQLRPINAKDRS